jgi:hypothetical protein
MNDEKFFGPFDIRGMNFFSMEADHFERDVHVIILGTLEAGTTYLTGQSEETDKEIDDYLKTAKGEAAEHAVEMQVDSWSRLSEQVDFLRNMALVALLSRLTHALRQVCRQGDIYAPLNPKGYGNPRDDEFKKIWAEFRERFGIEFAEESVTLIDALRRARNMVVHNGAKAKAALPMDKVDFSTSEFYDTKFITNYPQFVDKLDRVVISDKQLNEAVGKSVELVKYAAERLRGGQIEAAKKEQEEAKQKKL